MTQAISEYLSEAVYIAVLLTIGSYGIGTWLRKKTGWALMNPLLVSIVLTIGFLCVTDTSYEAYSEGTQIIQYLLTPATICLAVPLYEQIEHLKRNARAVTLGITAGVLASMLSIFILVVLVGLSKTDYITLLPKSITTAIGMDLSKELGGNVPVTIISIVVTGITGNIFAEKFLRLARIDHPVAKGIALGTAAHVIGTSKAMEIGQTEGAMSSLSIATSGILTVVAATTLASFF